jgi:hypothetical protein
MAEKINPEIMGFITGEEAHLQEKLRLIAQPYEAIVRDALMQYEDALRQFGLGRSLSDWRLRTDPDLESVKERANPGTPIRCSTMHYSAQIRTKAIMRLGYYSFLRGIRKIVQKIGRRRTESEEMKVLRSRHPQYEGGDRALDTRPFQRL